ncbi:MAG: hypothetical protein O6826_09600 [Acidobacteria bacterium]|nr:hypothetical protein [Acidobacteriota bacterium]MCZ6876890.1 hypothetical protein [Acidobacteriota bacterium]
MIAGLPWTAWLLLIAAVGLGLMVELIFYFRHRGTRKPTTPGREQPE